MTDDQNGDLPVDALIGADQNALHSLDNLLPETPIGGDPNRHPIGTVALPCGEHGRYHAFTYSMMTLRYPSGSRIGMARGLSIPRNLNAIMREMIGDWVWLIGDDHVFDGEILLRLLDRLYGENLDVVVPFCIRRQPPFAPVLFKNQREDGLYEPYAYDELPDHGIVECYAAGTAGMVVRKRVLDAIGDPWFENADREMATEDMEFCRRIRLAGFKIYADVDQLLGHIGNFTIWPKRVNRWGFLYDFGPGPDGAMNQIYINVGDRQAMEKEREEAGVADERGVAAAAMPKPDSPEAGA